MINNKYQDIHTEGILKGYIWCILLIPTFWGFTPGGNSLGQLFVSAFLFLFAILSLYIYNKRLVVIKAYFIIFFVQIICYILTLGIRQTDFYSIISVSDYSDVIRPLLYLIAVSYPLSLCVKINSIPTILNTIVYASVSVAIFDIIKLYPVGVSLMKLYTPLEPDSFNYLRLSGTFAYCYNYGFVLIFDLLFVIYTFKKKFLWSSILIILIFLTGSRSVLIALIVSLCLSFLISKMSLKSKLFYTFILLSSLVIIYNVLVYVDIPIVQDIISNIDKLISVADNGISSDGSAATRGRQLEAVFHNFTNHPILGSGPLKGSASPIEIQLGYYLSSWGILGLCIIVATFMTSIYFAYKCCQIPSKVLSGFSRANVLWVISALFVGMSTPITDQVRVFQLFYLIQGIQFCIYNQYYSNKKIDVSI